MLDYGPWASFTVENDKIPLNACTENYSTCHFIIYYTNPYVLYKFGWISMGNVRNRGRKLARKVLTPKEAEKKEEGRIKKSLTFN